MDLKQAAGEAALRHLRPHTAIGLGTGSTADCFLVALGREIGRGRFPGLVGVPTSQRSARRAAELGIPLTDLSAHPRLDVAVDGADEIVGAGGIVGADGIVGAGETARAGETVGGDTNGGGHKSVGGGGLALIKGLGGALLREKIVAQAAERFIVIADGGKVSGRLGTRVPLPVEVVPFQHAAHVGFFRSLGAEPTLRRLQPDSGEAFLTDNGNVIYDLRFPAGIADPHGLEMQLLRRAGVVDTGLFLGLATLALIATDAGIVELRP